MRLYGQTEEQEDVCQHQVEKENIVGVGFPKFQLEYEKVQDGRIQRQSQDENHDHDRCIEFIQCLVGGFAVLNELVGRVSHLSALFSSRLTVKISSHFRSLPENKHQQKKKKKKKKSRPTRFFTAFCNPA